MTGIASGQLKAIVAGIAILLVVARWAYMRWSSGRGDRVFTALFGALALVAVGNYFGFSTKPLTNPTSFNGYDLVHYYLNTKYFDELGYVGLYDAVVIADSERRDNFRRWRFSMMRDLDSSEAKPLSAVYARARQIKAAFSKQRWRQFKHDFRYLQRTMRRRTQASMLNDHGYNGPPTLQLVAGAITNAVPVERLKLLCHLETVLVLLMLGLIGRTFGLRMTILAVLWYAVSFSTRWPGIGQGIFRLDWAIAIVLALCLLHRVEPDDGGPLSRSQRARALGAGALLAYSAMMKLFPIVWLFGLGARAVWQLATKRRLDRVTVPLFAAFFATAAVLAVVTVQKVGTRNIAEFAEDIGEHLQPKNLSEQRMGLGIALAYRGEWRQRFPTRQAYDARKQLVGELKSVRYGVAFLALFLLGLTIRPRDSAVAGARTDAADATMLGFIAFYLLMIASHYYWVNRLSVVLHHGRDDRLNEGPHAVGLCMLFGIEILTNGVDIATKFRYVTTAVTSVAIGVYCAWVIAARLARTYRRNDPAPAEGARPTAA